MAKYRAKTVAVDAVQWKRGASFDGLEYDPLGRPCINRLGQRIYLEEGDWVVTEPSGLRHVLKPSVFRANYEAVAE